MLIIALCAPFLGSLAAGFLPAKARTTASVLAGALSIFCLGIIIAFYPDVTGGGVVREEISWAPLLGLNLSIRLGGLSLLFSALILGIGALVIFYSRYYMSAEDPVPRFFAFLLAFMGSMPWIGAVGKPYPVGFLLGTHQHIFIFAHRLLAPQPERTRWRENVADRDMSRRRVVAFGLSPSRQHCGNI